MDKTGETLLEDEESLISSRKLRNTTEKTRKTHSDYGGMGKRCTQGAYCET